MMFSMRITSRTRREWLATVMIYSMLALLLAILAWHGEAGPFWGRVDVSDSPLYPERTGQALRELAD